MFSLVVHFLTVIIPIIADQDCRLMENPFLFIIIFILKIASGLHQTMSIQHRIWHIYRRCRPHDQMSKSKVFNPGVSGNEEEGVVFADGSDNNHRIITSHCIYDPVDSL